ncbi:hypothetical protein V7S43_002091 [Phytophthora oleae]|uniref:Uncharacterized protein n=1 Tax=Phytophthora oleae TaxID=2107226 RepID=A0ABD3G2C1_9STRA
MMAIGQGGLVSGKLVEQHEPMNTEKNEEKLLSLRFPSATGATSRTDVMPRC